MHLLLLKIENSSRIVPVHDGGLGTGLNDQHIAIHPRGSGFGFYVGMFHIGCFHFALDHVCGLIEDGFGIALVDAARGQDIVGALRLNWRGAFV